VSVSAAPLSFLHQKTSANGSLWTKEVTLGARSGDPERWRWWGRGESKSSFGQVKSELQFQECGSMCRVRVDVSVWLTVYTWVRLRVHACVSSHVSVHV
jgi:hypothetical protein